MKKGLNGLITMQGVKNVEILSVAISGFRNISNEKIYFDSITGLVGLNGYGKSNVIDAIDFGLDFIHYPPEIKVPMMGSKKDIPILKGNVGEDFSFDIEVKITSKKQEYYVNYGYSFSWKTDNTPARIETEYLNIKKIEKNQRYSPLISREGANAKYRPSETGRCSKKVNIDDSNLVLAKLLVLDELYYIDIIQQLSKMQYFIERHLDASPSFEPAPFVIKGVQELELQGIQSIPRAIYYLKKDYEEKYLLLVDAFKQLFPRVVDVNVREIKLNQDSPFELNEDLPVVYTDSIYSMSIIDENLIQPISFERLSDGTKRVFLMLTFAVIADIKGLSMIAIEEPENSIHPALLQNYIDVLSQLVGNCKIIVTSHSPYVIQYLNPHSVYIGLVNTEGVSDFRRIAATKVNALLNDASAYDESLGDYLFGLLSDPDSNEYLEGYLENYVG